MRDIHFGVTFPLIAKPTSSATVSFIEQPQRWGRQNTLGGPNGSKVYTEC